jgi:hypothetical protein
MQVRKVAGKSFYWPASSGLLSYLKVIILSLKSQIFRIKNDYTSLCLSSSYSLFRHLT